jgi:hypothetical protein
MLRNGLKPRDTTVVDRVDYSEMNHLLQKGNTRYNCHVGEQEMVTLLRCKQSFVGVRMDE